MKTETNTAIPAPKLFNQPRILQQIGFTRIARFLDAFADDLRQSSIAPSGDGGKAANLTAPPPEPMTHYYFAEVADFLVGGENLPVRLRQAMATLEAPAAPENDALLDAAIQRHIPNVSLNRSCPLDCALELWFQTPDELAIFTPVLRSAFDEGGTAPVYRAVAPSEGGKSLQDHSNPAQRDEEAQTNTELTQCPRVQVNGQQNGEHKSNSAPIENIALSRTKFENSTSAFAIREIQPWPEPVDGNALLDKLSRLLNRFVVLPASSPIALALWILHTYAFYLREVTTYIGIESPEKQCGKTTLLTLLNELVNRPIAASNVSPPAFFRVIEQLSPTLLIDEGDTFLRGNDQLRGILNSGYKKKTAFVLRAGPAGPAASDDETEPAELNGQVSRFSCWCPKAIATIGRLPDTLADRCILIRMQRKTPNEKCERLRELDTEELTRQCARFVLDHQQQIASARPALPSNLNDRAADIWEPLLVLADLAGDKWPELARSAAVSLTASAQENNPLACLLLDIFILFTISEQTRLFSRQLVEGLNTRFTDRPWMELTNGKPVTDRWLSHQLRAYGIKPKPIRIGDAQARGYLQEDCIETFRRYIPKSELDSLLPDPAPEQPPSAPDGNPGPQTPNP